MLLWRNTPCPPVSRSVDYRHSRIHHLSVIIGAYDCLRDLAEADDPISSYSGSEYEKRHCIHEVHRVYDSFSPALRLLPIQPNCVPRYTGGRIISCAASILQRSKSERSQSRFGQVQEPRNSRVSASISCARTMVVKTFTSLVCSDLISRGIDITHVSHVVSYDAPVDMRKYVHRVGRTARAGREGSAWTLVEEQEVQSVRETSTDIF